MEKLADDDEGSYQLSDVGSFSDILGSKKELAKRRLIHIALLIIILIALISIIIIIITLVPLKNENEIEYIGEIECIYNIQTTSEKAEIIGKNYMKNSTFSIYINGKETRYSKEHKFETKGNQTAVFKLNENINMDKMFENISSLTSVKMTSKKDAQITSMANSFENCTNLKIIKIDGF